MMIWILGLLNCLQVVENIIFGCLVGMVFWVNTFNINFTSSV